MFWYSFVSNWVETESCPSPLLVELGSGETGDIMFFFHDILVHGGWYRCKIGSPSEGFRRTLPIHFRWWSIILSTIKFYSSSLSIHILNYCTFIVISVVITRKTLPQPPSRRCNELTVYHSHVMMTNGSYHLQQLTAVRELSIPEANFVGIIRQLVASLYQIKSHKRRRHRINLDFFGVGRLGILNNY